MLLPVYLVVSSQSREKFCFPTCAYALDMHIYLSMEQTACASQSLTVAQFTVLCMKGDLVQEVNLLQPY